MGRVARLGAGLAVLMIAASPGWTREDQGSLDIPEMSPPSVSEPSSAAPPKPAQEKPLTERVEPTRVSMQFQDANLKDVLKTFSQQTGINVIASGDVGEQAVTVYLEDVTPMDALDQILRASNLTYERPPGSEIYIVKPKPPEDASAQTITRVYRLKFARVSKSILAKAAAAFGARTPFEATLSQGGGTSGASGSTSSASGAAGGGSTSGGLGGATSAGGAGSGGTTVGIDEVISELLTKNGSVVVDGRTNSLIVTDVPDNFPRIEAALAALDIRTAQIVVDAELIETSLGKLKDLGVEWGTGSEGDLITFTPSKRSTRFPWGIFGEPIEPTSATPFTASTLDASSAKGILQAIESDTDTKILARPKVLTLDNESAVIRLTSDEAIGFTSTSQATTGTQTSEPERRTTGVVLVVTPQVNDNNYITMLVEPSVTKTVTSKLTPPSSGGSAVKDPRTRSARTLVRIRNGDTLVVGGLIDRTDETVLRRVPIASGIPILGELFKNTEVNNSTSEVVVFITPRLLEEATAEQIASTAKTPMGLREQEGPGARQEAIEETLNTLEKQQ